MLRTIGIVVLVVLLGVNVAAANAVTVADRTVLDPGFVREGLEAEHAYEELNDAAVGLVEGEAGVAPTGLAAIELDQAAVIEAALPPAYLEAQTEANIDRTYAYLYGERRDLVLSFDPEPVEERTAAAVAAQIRETPSTEIIGALVGDATVDVEGAEVDLAILSEMAADRSAYRSARGTVRDEIRAGVLDGFVDEAYQRADADRLLALVIEDYDPSAYTEAEKEAMVDEREPGIRDALRDEISSERGDEVDAAVEAGLDRVREAATDRVGELAAENTAGTDAALVDAATAMVLASVDGLTTDLAYDDYTARLGDAKARLASSAGSVAGELVARQLPASVDVTGELPASARRGLGTLRAMAQAADVLAIGLPLLGLVLIGGLWWLTRSPAITAGGAGGGLALGGLPGVVLAARLPAMVRDAVAGEDLLGLGDVIVGLASRVAAVLSLQSLVLVAVGVLVGAVGLVLYLDDRGAITLPGELRPRRSRDE